MTSACDVVLVTAWPGLDRHVNTVFECNNPQELPRAIDNARALGREYEADGALCLLKIALGGFVGYWGQRHRSWDTASQGARNGF